MRALEFVTGHVIYNLAYTYKFQLKTTNHANNLTLLLGFSSYPHSFMHSHLGSFDSGSMRHSLPASHLKSEQGSSRSGWLWGF